MASRPATSTHESFMSVSATPSMAAGAKGLPQTMQLPNVPKMTDERNRGKYVAEYERFEQELRKHHLGSAESTTTAGLRDLPSAFDRRVPLQNEPTAAEREYEHTQNLLSARRKKEQRLYNVTGTGRGGPAAAAATAGASGKKRNAATAPARGSEKSSIAIAASLPGGSVRSSTAAGPADTAGLQAAAPMAAAAVELPTATASPPRASVSITATAAAANARSSPAPAAKPVAHVRALSSPSLSSSQAAPAPAGANGTGSGGGLLLRTSAASRSGGAKKSVTVSSPRSTRPTAAPPTGTNRSAVTARPAALTPSPPPGARAAPKAATATAVAAPVAKLRSAKALEAALEARVQPSLGTSAVRARSGTARGTKNDMDDAADLVRVLVMPPEVFSDSVTLDTNQYDLDWVSGFRARPAQLVTLHNFLSTSHAAEASRGAARRINSPRSALVCLRNGISPSDLTPQTDTADASAALPTDPALREAVARFRREREAAHRSQLLSVLLDDYLTLCGKVPQAELIQAVQNPPEPATSVELPTSLQQRRERQRRIFETNKARMEKQLAMEQDLQARRAAAEARQAQAEQEANAALEAKARAEEEARALQEARREAQKAKNAEMEAFYQRQLEEKLARAEEKNQARLEAQQRLFDARHEARVRKEEERRARFQRNAQTQAELAAELEQKRAAKAAQLEAIQQEREARAAQDRQELLEKQARAAEVRAAAKQRAEEEEAQTRQAALQRQAEADARLDEFQARREEELAARAAEEQLKAQRRAQVYQDAQEKARKFQDDTRQRQLAHDAHLSEVQQQRALEMAIHREQEREEMNMKAFAVVKKQRMDEYGKLRTVADLVEKRKAADFVEAQRDALQEAMLRERDLLNAERDTLRAQFGGVVDH